MIPTSMRHSSFTRACALMLALGLGPGLASSARAQQPPPDPQQQQPQQWPPPAMQQPPQTPPPDQPPQQWPPPPPPQGTGDGTTTTPPPDGSTTTPPPGDTVVTQPQPGLETSTEEDDSMPPAEALLDGHVRSGPFMAGPGSFTFVLHNSILGAAGGFGTQLISSQFNFDRGKEGMLVGTLVGMGLGFGISTWWQFTHWMDSPVAAFSVVNGLYAGMLAAGLVDSLSRDLTALAYSAFICAELGGWLTAAVGGGEMKLADGLAIASAGAWAGAYTALVLATLTYAGGTPPTSKAWVDTLLIAPGIGASALAVALIQIRPTANQVIRGDLFGLGVGAAVLVTAGLVVGWTTPTTYILTLLSSAGALAAVSIFWEEAAEKPAEEAVGVLFGGGRRKLASKKRYNNPWW